MVLDVAVVAAVIVAVALVLTSPEEEVIADVVELVTAADVPDEDVPVETGPLVEVLVVNGVIFRLHAGNRAQRTNRSRNRCRIASST